MYIEILKKKYYQRCILIYINHWCDKYVLLLRKERLWKRLLPNDMTVESVRYSITVNLQKTSHKYLKNSLLKSICRIQFALEYDLALMHEGMDI